MEWLASLELWQWIAIAAVVVVALVVIICIIVWACNRKGKKAKRTESVKSEDMNESKSVGSAESKTEPEPVSEPEREPKTKAEEQPEEKPAPKAEPKAEEKPVEKPAPEPAPKNGTKTYHISKRKDDGKWQIKAEGGVRAIKLFATQAEAIEYAKQLAQNQGANVMIHKLDGSFRKLNY